MFCLLLVPCTSEISCEFLMWNEIWTRPELNLTSRRQIFSQEILPWLALSLPRTGTLQDHQYVICYVVLTQCCLNGTFVWSRRPVFSVLLKYDPSRVKGDSKGFWLGWGQEALKRCIPHLTTVAFFFFFYSLQVNFERRHPFFTRLLKRNAKWRTVRRQMELQAVRVRSSVNSCSGRRMFLTSWDANLFIVLLTKKLGDLFLFRIYKYKRNIWTWSQQYPFPMLN